ncbi:MAG: hypothetical protein P8J18_04330 [Halieaceae bacterium]|nr:hypothetical protein [Halieaceae bacterium]
MDTIISSFRILTILLLTSLTCYAAEDTKNALTEIIVTAIRVTNDDPAGTYTSLASNLRYNPIVEIQSRGMPEAQSDVTVRGGLFENTGFKIGAATIIDPQTGHYSIDLPISSSASISNIALGIDNALYGFNATMATIHYKLDQISPGGKFSMGLGNDSMNFQSLEGAIEKRQSSEENTTYKLDAARSSGDGTIDDGDHQFKRFNLQIQHTSDQTQTDFIFGYQDKFYAWPGAYTGFAIYPETDHTKTLLALVNYKKETSNGWWEMAGFYRRLRDDYDYDRKTKESGLPGSFDHETRVYGASIQARINAREVTWRFSNQLSADELVYSTDLTHGKFYSRSYLKTSIVPERTFFYGDNLSMRIRGGASFDWSNRDDSKILPLLGITLSKEHETGRQFASLEWSESSQLPGYTALNSRSNGLFGGNPNLGRETSQQLTASIGFNKYNWRYVLTGFYREDDDTVDWTYYSGAPYSRQANAVDLEVTGIETSITSQWKHGELILSYAHLNKNNDYRQPNVDASYYALNFPKHRLVVSSKIKINQNIEFRLDTEYREQERNTLRKSSSKAFFLSAGLQWKPVTNKNIVFGLNADNVTDETFERFPGTPALGRQLSTNFSYGW